MRSTVRKLNAHAVFLHEAVKDLVRFALQGEKLVSDEAYHACPEVPPPVVKSGANVEPVVVQVAGWIRAHVASPALG